MFIFFITVDTHSIHEMDPVDAAIIDWAMIKKQDVFSNIYSTCSLVR